MSTVDYRIFRVASLALVNAMLFQEVLSKNAPVKTLRKTAESLDIVGAMNEEWKEIENKIDFLPIFRIAREILLALPSSPETDATLRILAKTAINLSQNRAALRHDLMGRIFHRLLADGKYYGAFYTKIPSATLLLKLAVDSSNWSINWKNPKSISKLKIADFACGTGTLLKAALAAIVDKHIDKSITEGGIAKPDRVHKLLVEEGVWGFDVLSSAVHLAAAAIAMHDPHVAVDKMHLFALPIGGSSQNLGSIDFAKKTSKRELHIQDTLIGASIGPQDATTKEKTTIKVPLLHLCTMNPPFTRSVYANFLFGGIGVETERAELQKKLRQVLSAAKLEANITSGLGSVFVAIADNIIEEKNGVLALVLPKTVLSGQSWEPTRKIFKKYHLQYIVCSHEPDNWNFSESTSLSEVLLVLAKRSRKTTTQKTIFVNLSNQPKTSIEALSVASLIQKKSAADLSAKTGTSELKANGTKFGEMTKLTRNQIENTSWAIPVSFAQTDLCRISYYLSQGIIMLPAIGKVGTLKTVQLSKIATLGPDGRDVYDAFAITDSKTPYSALWGYDANVHSKILQSANRYLSPLATPLHGRALRDPHLLWSRSGTLMLSKGLRLTSAGVVAVVLPCPALSNVWWATRWISEDEKECSLMERNLALWFNSTLGLVSMMMQRQETEGSWVKFPKAWYEQLDVFDMRQLNNSQKKVLDDLWKQVHTESILSIPQIENDPVRKMIDEGFSNILNIPPVDQLRSMLSREPLISMRPL